MSANLKTIYPYSDIANFKTEKVVINNGHAVLDTPLKDTRPFAVDFENGLEPLVGADKSYTIVGSADADAKWLDVKGDSQRAIRFPLTPNLGSYMDQLTLRYKFKPAFNSGSNSDNYALFFIEDSDGTQRLGLCYKNGTQKLRAHVTNDDKGVLASLEGDWSFSQGVEYEIEVNINYKNDQMNVFVNGEHKFYTPLTTIIRTFPDNFLVLGSNNVNYKANHEIKDFELYTTLMRSDNSQFTDEMPRNIEKKYETNGAINALAPILTDKLVSITPVVTNTVNTDTRYQVEVNSQAKFYNGTNWADATSETNSLDEINNNLATLDLSAGAQIILKAFFSGNGYESPELDELSVEYNFYRSYVKSKTTLVYGNLVNNDGTPAANKKIKFTKDLHAKQGDALVLNTVIEVVTNSDGSFAVPIIETESTKQVLKASVEMNGKPLEFQGVSIPDRETVNLTELIK